MASKLSTEEDDRESLVCGICLEYYNDDGHLPKFLMCFHSCCISCLKSFVASTVACPFCRKETKIKGGVDKLTTNFYIMPRVLKLVAKRKEVEEIIVNTKDNWAGAVALRRDVLKRFKAVQDSLQHIKDKIIEKSDDNNQKIAILQSLLEDTSTSKDFDQLLNKMDLHVRNYQNSKEDLSKAQALYSSVVDIETYFCSILLSASNGESNYQITTWKEKNLTFNRKSSHGPPVGAFQSVLSYILYSMREQQMWSGSTSQEAQSCRPEAATARSKVAPLYYSSFSDSGSSCGSGEIRQCYMEFAINGTIQPKVVFSLYFDEAPIMSEHFMNYCQGISKLSYQSTRIFMSEPGNHFTGGNFNEMKLVGTISRVSEVEERYLADQSTLDDRKGALRMRHRGRCEGGVYVSSQFSVICRDHGFNTQMTTVFGYVEQGLDVCLTISRVDANANDIIIHSCGAWPIED